MSLVKVASGWDVFMAVNAGFTPGGVFWNGDEWTFNDGANYYALSGADALAHALAVIASFCGPGPKSVCVQNSDVFGSSFRADLATAGHTVTVDTSPGDGTGYDFVFSNLTGGWTGASNNARNETMWTFVQNGGGVYSTMGQNANEHLTMAVLLAYCGITYTGSYVLGSSWPATRVGSWPASLFGGANGLSMNGAGQFTALSTPPSGGYNGRWQAEDESGGADYYVLAAWWADVSLVA
jgi:hypothetical protein